MVLGSLRRRLGIRQLTWPKVIGAVIVVTLLWWKFSPLTSTSSLRTHEATSKSYSWTSGGLEVNHHGETVLKGKLGEGYYSHAEPFSCGENSLCSTWSGKGQIKITPYSDKGATCYRILSTSLDTSHNPKDCFSTKGSHWYGGAETYRDRWPIEMNLPEHPHVSDTGTYGSVLERYWFSNKGVGIFVDDLVPLYISFSKDQDQKFCLMAKYDGKIYRNWDSKSPFLSYTICVKDNIKELHTYMLDKYIAKPKGIPDEKMIKYPVWTTWAKYKSFITQEVTLQFTDEIVEHGFPASQIELDDRYTVNYGDYIFDPKKFPDPKAMVKHIHSKGFRITVWTHPFSNTNTQSYAEGAQRGYWVMDKSGQKTGMAGWWRGLGGVLDVTNKEAVKWYFHRLGKIREYGVDGHKYDAGEIGFLPKEFTTMKRLKNPCHYSTIYAETMYNNTNNYMQVRVGYKSQHLPIFVSMMDRNSDWGYNMGLHSLITSSLMFSSMGYYFIMPDMIGGNAYCAGTMDCTNVKPERELFIRWLQLNAFLPMMQFSFTPWQYDNEVVEIAKHYVNLHSDYVGPRLIALAKDSMQTGHPIIRPMWWVAPNDHVTHTMDSQFMVGDDLLVAPILSKGATGRDVYLPQGHWKNVISGKKHHVDMDGFYLKNVEASLHHIPYFERILEK